jgi:hypothetical protein
MVSTLDFESSDPGSNPGRTSFCSFADRFQDVQDADLPNHAHLCLDACKNVYAVPSGALDTRMQGNRL